MLFAADRPDDCGNSNHYNHSHDDTDICHRQWPLATARDRVEFLGPEVGIVVCNHRNPGLFSSSVDVIEEILPQVISDSTVNLHSIHGLAHWARVERNALFLASSVGANERIVSLFAYLHDCRRRNDGFDPGHGPRAAKYTNSIRHVLVGLTDAEMKILTEACDGHTRRQRTDDPTIAVCWDADRLDLPRVGIRPRSMFFNTPLAISMVKKQDFSPLDKLELRHFPNR